MQKKFKNTLVKNYTQSEFDQYLTGNTNINRRPKTKFN